MYTMVSDILSFKEYRIYHAHTAMAKRFPAYNDLDGLTAFVSICHIVVKKEVW
jgi:hypothetical protein